MKNKWTCEMLSVLFTMIIFSTVNVMQLHALEDLDVRPISRADHKFLTITHGFIQPHVTKDKLEIEKFARSIKLIRVDMSTDDIYQITTALAKIPKQDREIFIEQVQSLISDPLSTHERVNIVKALVLVTATDRSSVINYVKLMNEMNINGGDICACIKAVQRTVINERAAFVRDVSLLTTPDTPKKDTLHLITSLPFFPTDDRPAFMELMQSMNRPHRGGDILTRICNSLFLSNNFKARTQRIARALLWSRGIIYDVQYQKRIINILKIDLNKEIPLGFSDIAQHIVNPYARPIGLSAEPAVALSDAINDAQSDAIIADHIVSDACFTRCLWPTSSRVSAFIRNMFSATANLIRSTPPTLKTIQPITSQDVQAYLQKNSVGITNLYAIALYLQPWVDEISLDETLQPETGASAGADTKAQINYHVAPDSRPKSTEEFFNSLFHYLQQLKNGEATGYLGETVFLNSSEVVYYVGFIEPIIDGQTLRINPAESLYRRCADMFWYDENDFKINDYLQIYGEKDQMMLELALNTENKVDVVEIAAMEKLFLDLKLSAEFEMKKIQLE